MPPYIAFGSTSTKYISHRLALEWSFHPTREHLSACLYSCDDEDYDNAIFKDWGWEARHNNGKTPNDIYIDNLYDRVEHLFNIELDKRKTLPNAKDRLYKRAIIRYFEELLKEISKNVAESSKVRYTMTYTSDWTPDQVSYLRSLAQIAGIVDKGDHPDRLLMYGEGESIIRILQEPNHCFSNNIKHGYRYLICDMKDTEIKMSMYNIELPVDAETNIKVGQRCDWDINYMNEPPQLRIGTQDLLKKCETYLKSKLSTSSKGTSFQNIEQRENYRRRAKNILVMKILELSREIIKSNQPFEHHHPFKHHLPLGLSPWKSHPFNSAKKSSQTSEVSGEVHTEKEDTFEMTIHPAELEENVLRPFCNLIVKYLRNILQGVGDSVESIIFVGQLCHSVYLMELVEDLCKGVGTKCIHGNGAHIIFDPILNGAIRKSIDKVRGRDGIPEIELQESSKPINSTMICTKLFFFIDYTSKNTKILYCHTQPGHAFDSASLKRISDWPGQSSLDESLPTFEVMLIPTNNVNSGTGKKIVSLKENNDHSAHFLEQTQGGKNGSIYYTFKKCKRDIIWFTHELNMSGKESNCFLPDDVEEPQIAKYNSNANINESAAISATINEPVSSPSKNLSSRRNHALHAFNVTQQRISFKEFSLVYFEYLTSFLIDHNHSKIGIKGAKFCYCLTRDSYSESDEFRLTDEDIYDIVSKCGIPSKEVDGSQHTLLSLERADATALYCRDLIGTIDTNDRSEDTGFIQLQLNTDQCLLLFNRIPFNHSSESDTQLGKSRNIIHKYAKSKKIPFNFMDITCQNMWIHVQKHQQNLLKKCRKHSPSKRFFNANNMQVFKGLLLAYLSTTSLQLMHGEQVHDIGVCGEEECCRVHIANMDLVQFCFVPAINRLISELHCCISNHNFHQGLHIRNIFLLGVFVFCRSRRDYKFLENNLLTDLRKMNFNHQINNTQITKVEEDGLNEDDVINDERDRNSLANIASKGSIMYALNPYNRLFERFATKSYAVKLEIRTGRQQLLNGEDDNVNGGRAINIEDTAGTELGNKSIECEGSIHSGDDSLSASEVPYATCSQLDSQTKIKNNMLITMIREGAALAPLKSIEEEISTEFTILNCSKGIQVFIELHILKEDFVAECKHNLYNCSKYMLEMFHFWCRKPSYPIYIKAQLSQTGLYKFWVEYDGHINTVPIIIREKLLLKSHHI